MVWEEKGEMLGQEEEVCEGGKERRSGWGQGWGKQGRSGRGHGWGKQGRRGRGKGWGKQEEETIEKKVEKKPVCRLLIEDMDYLMGILRII